MINRFGPGCGCCVATTDPTPNCTNCDGDNGPAQWQVTLSGLHTGGCCPEVETTYILDPVAAAPCQWRLTLSPTSDFCGHNRITLLVLSGAFFVEVASASFASMTYQSTVGVSMSCATTGLVIPLTGLGGSQCNSTNSLDAVATLVAL